MPNARFQPLPKAGARNERTLEAVGCKPLFGGATGDPPLWLFCEARLDKVLIEGKGRPDTQLLHDEKGDTICEGVIFVLMALEIRPPFVK